MSGAVTANGNRPTPEEMHRLKQRYRNQYQLMLTGLNQLSEVLPPTIGADKTKSKQILLSEAVHYIHYLQLCIYQLGKDTGTSEQEIGRCLHWDTRRADSCRCLQKLKDMSSGCSSMDSPDKVTHHDISEDDEPETHGPKVARRCSTPTSISESTFSRKHQIYRTSQQRRSTIRDNGSGSKISRPTALRLSPIKSPLGWIWSRARQKGKGRKLTSSFRSPPGTYCDIISPPNSYRRTIIEDSPQNLSNLQNWENVSVRKSSIPWMPKPDNKYGSAEDLANKIVLHYGQTPDMEPPEDDDVDGHVLSNSHPLDSFLDSSYTEDEHAPFTDLETSVGLARPRPNLDDAKSTSNHPRQQGERGAINSVTGKATQKPLEARIISDDVMIPSGCSMVAAEEKRLVPL